MKSHYNCTSKINNILLLDLSRPISHALQLVQLRFENNEETAEFRQQHHTTRCLSFYPCRRYICTSFALSSPREHSTHTHSSHSVTDFNSLPFEIYGFSRSKDNSNPVGNCITEAQPYINSLCSMSLRSMQ